MARSCFNSLDFHPSFVRGYPEACLSITRESGKAYSKRRNNQKVPLRTSPTSPVQNTIPGSPSLAPQGLSEMSIPTAHSPSILAFDQAQQQQQQVAPNPTTTFAQSFNVPPSILGNQANDANVLKDLYEKLQRKMAWQSQHPNSASGRVSPDHSSTSGNCGRSSATASPIPTDIFGNRQKQQPNVTSVSSGPMDASVSFGGLPLDDSLPEELDSLNIPESFHDAFEPIPLSRIDEMQCPPSFLYQQQTRADDDNDIFLFEPRSIEDMVDQPNNNIGLFDFIPTLSPKQQALLEYSLPITLPMLFSVVDQSKLGLLWCFVIVVGHTLQTLFTSFGPTATDLIYKPSIDLVQHHFMDSMWLQTLFSAMILLPQYFGSYSIYVAAAMIPLIPIYLAVSLKTHFCRNVLALAAEDNTSTRFIKSKKKSIQVVWEIINSTCTWYSISVLLILVGHQVASFNLLVVGVFVMNATPISSCETYRYHIQKASKRLLPTRNSTKQKLL